MLTDNISSIDSTQYYNDNSQQYFDTTVSFNNSSLYNLFVPYLPKGTKILDAGCGSGRDSKYFLDQGFKVTAFDGSAKMAALASKFTGLEVAHKDFSKITDKEAFDGIWTSASLLHVPKVNLLNILEKLKTALKLQDVWYMSFRYGDGEKNEGDRYFNDQTAETLKVPC